MILHITHNDLDGVGCAILVKSCFPSVHTRYSGYDDLDDILMDIPDEYNTVIITDLGPSARLVESVAAEKELILIDHHASTIPLKEYPFVYHSIQRCATLLTYEYFTDKGYDLERYKDFAECVNDFDLWILKRDDSLHMNMLLSLFGIGRFERRFFSEPYTGFTEHEAMFIALEEERRTGYITRATKSAQYFKDTQQRSFAVVFAEMYISELGNNIINEGLADYVVLINAQRKKVSLRSAKDTDIREIAESQGGGGHKNAAGFNADTDFCLEEYLEDIGLIR